MLDYRKQNLKGRSFRGQNLAGADFSGAKLHGADFRGANLTDAKFIDAGTGIAWPRQLSRFALGLLLGVFSGLLALVFFAAISWFASTIAKFWSLENTIVYLTIVIGVYMLLHIIGVLTALHRQNWSVLWLFESVLLPVFIAGTGTGTGTEAIAAVAVAVAGVVAGAGALVVAGVVVMAVAVTVVEVVVAAGAGAGVIAGTGAVLWLSFGIYLNWRCLKHEEPMLLALRRLSLAWRNWGGSDFRGATLTGADFSQADLRHARFSGTAMIGCRWRQATNLHLADTRNTLLERRAIRQLLSVGDLGDKRFAHANLRGAVLAGLDLHGADFYHADLSHADLSGCDLQNADFSEAMALATHFNGAEFTGAILENWNVDKTTRFDGAQARFVYLKRDQSEKNPPQGEFGPGDFAKLYQEIANTVDFIAHTPEELQALLRAIEAIKAQGGGIFIQQMERKADSVVLRVQSEDHEAVDKAATYAEVEQQKQVEILALRQEHQLQLMSLKLNHAEELRTAEKQNKDLLAGLLHSAIDKPNAPIINENHFMAQDHSRKIENSTLTNSNAALGDRIRQSLHIEQLAEGELKTLLQRLGALIDDAPLKKADRQALETQIDQLAAQVGQATPPKTEIGKTIGTLKDLTAIFKDLPAIGTQYGILLAELAQLIA